MNLKPGKFFIHPCTNVYGKYKWIYAHMSWYASIFTFLFFYQNNEIQYASTFIQIVCKILCYWVLLRKDNDTLK